MFFFIHVYPKVKKQIVGKIPFYILLSLDFYASKQKNLSTRGLVKNKRNIIINF